MTHLILLTLLSGCYLSHEYEIGDGDTFEVSLPIAEPTTLPEGPGAKYPELVAVTATPGTDDAVWCRPEALEVRDGIGAGLGRHGGVTCEPVPLGLGDRAVSACYRLEYDRPVLGLNIVARVTTSTCGGAATCPDCAFRVRHLEVYRDETFVTTTWDMTETFQEWTVGGDVGSRVWHICRPPIDPTAAHFEIDAVEAFR